MIPPTIIANAQALQECQGRLKGLVQGMAAMQAELGELQAKQQHKAAQDRGRSGLLPALHSPAGRCCVWSQAGVWFPSR